ncbi:MAG TPA: glycosyltransferase family 4 protein [Candidatus Binatia bacterium]|jgi:glycosyltransferase involved in cell wall biosynthesis|nr:glycosyltransferase family 4 protein [Candidatus Binatia bacterium]
MRIALYHNLPSGGAKRAANEIVRRLQEQHRTDVYTLSQADHDFADLRPHVHNHFIYPFRSLPLLPSPFGRANQLSRLLDLYRVRNLARRIAHDIEQRDYEVVFVHPCQVEIAPSVLSYLQRTPTVYFCQEPLRRVYERMPTRPYDGLDSSRRRLLNTIDPLPRLYMAALASNDRRNTRAAGAVLVNSDFMRRAVQNIYGLQAQVAYLGVDVQRFYPQQRERRPMVLSVGSLTPLKGFDFLIEAMSRLPVALRVPLVIASNFENGPERHYLRQLAADRGVDLQLHRNITDERLLELYNEAQLVAYAAIREPFGLVPLEAMACATPVVGVAEGGVQESVVHEQTGLLTERDPDDFSRALARLLGDAQLARTYGQQGRQLVEEHWSWDRATARVEQSLHAIDRHRGARLPANGRTRALNVRLTSNHDR